MQEDKYLFTKNQFGDLMKDLHEFNELNRKLHQNSPFLLCPDRYMDENKIYLPQTNQEQTLVERMLFNRRIDDLTDSVNELGDKVSELLYEVKKIRETIDKNKE